MVRKANHTVSHTTSVHCQTFDLRFLNQNNCFELALEGHPSSCYSVLFESSGVERLHAEKDWFSRSSNVEGENLRGNKMNSLQKYKDVQSDRSKDLSL